MAWRSEVIALLATVLPAQVSEWVGVFVPGNKLPTNSEAGSNV